MTTLRIVVADDHPLMLSAIVARLSIEADLDVVATARTCAGLVDEIAAHQPDVAVIDVSMPDGSTLEVLAALQASSPATGVLILSATDEPAAVTTALERGARGFLSKETEAESIAGHVRAVAAGRTVLDPRSAAAVAAGLREPVTTDQALSAPRARGPAPRRRGKVEPADRHDAVRRGQHGEDPPRSRVRQTRRQRPGRRGRPGQGPQAALAPVSPDWWTPQIPRPRDTAARRFSKEWPVIPRQLTGGTFSVPLGRSSTSIFFVVGPVPSRIATP